MILAALLLVVYGLGMGLTSAPATESMMGAISRAKAGVGSAVIDSTTLIGGTLGVTIIGSVYASVYGSRLTATLPAKTPGPVAAIAHQSVGAAYLAAGKLAALGHPALGQALQHDTQPAQGLLTIAIDTGEAPVHLLSRDCEFEIRRGRPAAADVRLSGQAWLIGGYLGGLLSPDEARRLDR
jgi:hypothetical protein